LISIGVSYETTTKKKEKKKRKKDQVTPSALWNAWYTVLGESKGHTSKLAPPPTPTNKASKKNNANLENGSI
jgi:hypothetical protein